uniref:Uncharacterized protein n=1 Tax=Anopheles maculatus TaxID=74869 RepID=A0A182SM60_9DIPT
MKRVQLLWSVALLLLCPLSENPTSLVESKVRNRVQKWQQRTWRARFGAGPRRDWKSAFDPPKSSHRSRYGLSPREDDFFTPDEVPNAYSNYHYRRVGSSKQYPKGQRASKLASNRWRDRDVAKHTAGNRLKRHTRTGHVEPSEELKDYLDPLDLMLLGDDPNSEFIPLQPEFEQQYIMGTEENSREIPNPASPDAIPPNPSGGDKKLKEFKIVFHHRNLNGSGVRSGVSLGLFAFLIISTLGISGLFADDH